MKYIKLRYNFCSHFLAQQQALRDKPMDLKTKEKLMVEVFPQWLQEKVTKFVVSILVLSSSVCIN
jgi:hypothetical protein